MEINVNWSLEVLASEVSSGSQTLKKENKNGRQPISRRDSNTTFAINKGALW